MAAQSADGRMSPSRQRDTLRPSRRAQHRPCKGSMAENHHSPSGQALTSSASDLLLPFVVVPAKAGTSLLLTKRRMEQRNASLRRITEEIRQPASHSRSPSQGRSAPGFPVSSLSALGRESCLKRKDQQRPQNPHPPLAREVAGRRPDGGVSRHREGNTPPSRAPRATPPLPGEDG